MSDSVIIHVPGPAVPKGRPRVSAINGHARAYTPAKTRHYETQVRLFAAQAMAGRLMLQGPLAVQVTVLISPPSSWSQKRRREACDGDIAPTKKPDLDNLIKCLDALNGVVYSDDSAIVALWARKEYSDAPGLRINVSRCTHARAAP